MAMETILSDLSVSMSAFKKSPTRTIKESGGQAVAVLSHNKPTFYIVPPDRYKAMLDQIDDMQLVRTVNERLKQKTAPLR